MLSGLFCFHITAPATEETQRIFAVFVKWGEKCEQETWFPGREATCCCLKMCSGGIASWESWKQMCPHGDVLAVRDYPLPGDSKCCWCCIGPIASESFPRELTGQKSPTNPTLWGGVSFWSLKHSNSATKQTQSCPDSLVSFLFLSSLYCLFCLLWNKLIHKE